MKVKRVFIDVVAALFDIKKCKMHKFEVSCYWAGAFWSVPETGEAARKCEAQLVCALMRCDSRRRVSRRSNAVSVVMFVRQCQCLLRLLTLQHSYLAPLQAKQ